MSFSRPHSFAGPLRPLARVPADRDHLHPDPAELIHVAVHIAQIRLASRAVEATVELDHRPPFLVGEPLCAAAQGLDFELRCRAAWLDPWQCGPSIPRFAADAAGGGHGDRPLIDNGDDTPPIPREWAPDSGQRTLRSLVRDVGDVVAALRTAEASKRAELYASLGSCSSTTRRIGGSSSRPTRACAIVSEGRLILSPRR